jgi:hypothetical protein
MTCHGVALWALWVPNNIEITNGCVYILMANSFKPLSCLKTNNIKQALGSRGNEFQDETIFWDDVPCSWVESD